MEEDSGHTQTQYDTSDCLRWRARFFLKSTQDLVDTHSIIYCVGVTAHRIAHVS